MERTFNVEHVDNRRRCRGHKPDLNWLQIEGELGRNLLKISGKLIARPLSGLDIPPSTHAHLLLLPLKFHHWRPRGGTQSQPCSGVLMQIFYCEGLLGGRKVWWANTAWMIIILVLSYFVGIHLPQVTLITFVWLLLHRVFSNVSSNHLHERMHSHIDCICLTFLHCVFSNVSLNCMPEKRQSHIGCICLAFLHCAFSNVPSNWMPGRLQSRIGYICLAFLHCVFSYVS